MKRFRGCWGLALMLLAAGCVTIEIGDPVTKGKAVGGKTIHYGEWKAKKPRDIMINLVDFEKHPPLDRVTVEERIRDNQITNQRVHFDGGQSVISMEHVWSYFDPARDRDILLGLEGNRTFLSKSFERDRITWEESKKVYRYGRRGGWIHHARIGPKTCILGHIGLLSTGKDLPSGVSGDVYDTSIRLRDCSGKRLLKDYEKFFNGVKLVPQGYNRD